MSTLKLSAIDQNGQLRHHNLYKGLVMGRKGRVMPKEDSYNAFSDASSLLWEKNSWLSYQRWEKGQWGRTLWSMAKFIFTFVCINSKTIMSATSWNAKEVCISEDVQKLIWFFGLETKISFLNQTLVATDSLSARDRLGKSNTGRSLFLLFAPRFGWSKAADAEEKDGQRPKRKNES